MNHPSRPRFGPLTVVIVAAIVTGSALIASAIVGATAVAAQEASGAQVEVVVAPATIATEIGMTTDLQVSVTNTGAVATAALAVHLDITNPSGAGSVDPEDWSSTLTRQIGVLQPGATHELIWDVKPISGGDFSLYVTVLGELGGSEIWVSSAVDVAVRSRRSLNPDGVLPVAIAMPALVLGAWTARLRLRR